jgi:hypothetical protein
MSITITAYVGKSGKIIYFFPVNSANSQVVPVTGVASNPTVTVGGTPVTLYGPVWTNTGKNAAFVAYSIASGVTVPISSSATVLYSAAANWLTTASGNAPSATSAAVTNSTGQGEPPVAGVKGLRLSASDMTMPMSMNTSSGPGTSALGISAVKNWRFHAGSIVTSNGQTVTCGTGFGAAVGSIPAGNGTPLGQPISWTAHAGGYLYFSVFGNVGAAVDGRNLPGPCSASGTNQSWRIVYEEQTLDPANPLYDPTGNSAMSFWISSGNSAVTGVDTTSFTVGSPTTLATRVVGTIGSDSTSAANTVLVTYPNIQRPITASNLASEIRITWSSPLNKWTAGNFWVFAPGNTTSRSDLYAADDVFCQMLTAPNGRTINWLRMDQGVLNNGSDGAVDPSDLRDLRDWQWNAPPNLGTASTPTPNGQFSANVIGIRYINTNPADTSYLDGNGQPYSSTKIYSSTYGYGGTDPSGPTGAQQYLPLATTDFGEFLDLTNANGNNDIVCECRTASPHNLKTGQVVSFPAATAGVPNNLPTISSDGLFTTTIGSPKNTTPSVWVTGASTFCIVWFQSNTGNATSAGVVKINSHTEIACNFNVTWSQPTGGFCPYEYLAAACNKLQCHCYLNVPPFANDACLQAICNRVNAVLDSNLLVLPELCDETWNGGFLQGWQMCRNIGALIAYLPASTTLGPLTAGTTQWYTTPATGSVGLGGDAISALRQLQLNDIAVSVFGESRVVRGLGAQFVSGSLSALHRMNFVNSVNAPVAAMMVAPYMQISSDTTFVLAFTPTGTTGAGNFSADMINEIDKHYYVYNTSQWSGYQSVYNDCQSYTGPHTGVGGASLRLPTGQTMAPGGKPILFGYEGSWTNLVQKSLGTALLYDCYYHPTCADVQTAYMYAVQQGHPYVAGSGLCTYCEWEYGGGPGGGSGQFLYPCVMWHGQQTGPGTGTSLTSTLPYSGATTPTGQLYATAQGGAPADGASHHVSNDLVKMWAFQQWMANANGAPAPFDYTLTGPPSGVDGIASTNFTLTPSGTIPTDTVTLSDGGAGGTFAPTSLTFTSSSTPQTFTYSPAHTGTITITLTSGTSYPITGSPASYSSTSVGYTLTGPASGFTGAMSTNFTLTPSGTIPSDTVTLSDGGAGGTFAPTSLTLTSSSSSQTFTYTPAVAGFLTLTATSGDGGSITGSPFTYDALPLSYTLTGPTTATVGTASTNFTVTPGQPIPSDTIIFSDLGSLGSFAPTFLTFTASITPQTFTYTPALSGTRTIAVSSTAGWTVSGSPATLRASAPAPSADTVPDLLLESFANLLSEGGDITDLEGGVLTAGSSPRWFPQLNRLSSPRLL